MSFFRHAAIIKSEIFICILIMRMFFCISLHTRFYGYDMSGTVAYSLPKQDLKRIQAECCAIVRLGSPILKLYFIRALQERITIRMLRFITMIIRTPNS